MSYGENRDPMEALALDAWRAALDGGAFEEVHTTLEAVVAVLERGGLRLDDSIACFELGVQLAERCEQILADAELRVTRLEAILERAEGLTPDDEPPHPDDF